MKRSLLFSIALALPIAASAFEGYAEVDGINYYILTKGAYAEVAQKNGGYEGDVVIPSSIEYDGVTCTVTAIRSGAFYYDFDLTSVVIPSTVTTIGSQAFYRSKLKTVNIPSSVTSLGGECFYKCESLESVMVDNLESWCKIEIGNDACPLQYAKHFFVGEEEIKHLIIPSSISVVNGRTFHGYKGLESVTFENGVTSIGDFAFYECTNLESVKMSNTITEIGKYAFYRCSSLNNLKLSDELLSIKESCFQECTNLSSLYVPNSVKEIEFEAFYKCKNLKTIILSQGLKKIGTNAFSNCGELTDVYSLAEVSPIFGNSYYKDYMLPFFNSYPEYATLHVPENSISDYQANPVWKVFGNIVALTEEELGIKEVKDESNETSIYTLDGRTSNAATRGFNIVKSSNGKTQIVFMK